MKRGYSLGGCILLLIIALVGATICYGIAFLFVQPAVASMMPGTSPEGIALVSFIVVLLIFYLIGRRS